MLTLICDDDRNNYHTYERRKAKLCTLLFSFIESNKIQSHLYHHDMYSTYINQSNRQLTGRCFEYSLQFEVANRSEKSYTMRWGNLGHGTENRIFQVFNSKLSINGPFEYSFQISECKLCRIKIR